MKLLVDLIQNGIVVVDEEGIADFLYKLSNKGIEPEYRVEEKGKYYLIYHTLIEKEDRNRIFKAYIKSEKGIELI